MGPKKNKGKGSTSAYYYFMLDVQNRHPGRKISLAEAAKIAGPEWERMDNGQRAPYKKLADAEKTRQRGSGEKFDSFGRSIADIDNEKEAQIQKEESMRKAVKERLDMASINNTLIQEEFFFIDINIFCEVYDKEDEMYYYYPAEIAISKYTLAEGISKTYHSAINPGRVRTGYARTAQQHSNETHQLPIPPDALGETDMGVIFNQILEFLKDNCNNKSTIPFMYTLPKQIPIVEGVLRQLCDHKGISVEFKIFNLPELFMYLMNDTASAQDKFDTPTIAQLAIEKDVYDYYRGLACDYHETTDVINMCSLSKVKRWGFIISDYCLQFLDVTIILGQHLPKQVNSSLIKNMDSRCESRAESDFTTVSRKSHARSIQSNSVCSTPAPSVISDAPRLQRKNQSGAIKKIAMERSHSPTESMATYVSNMSLNSYQDPQERVFTPNLMDFPLLGNRSTESASIVGKLEQIRRPKTQSEVSAVRGTAAALLGYTTDTSTTDSTWSNMAKKRSQKSAGRGRGIAANFSNP